MRHARNFLSTCWMTCSEGGWNTVQALQHLNSHSANKCQGSQRLYLHRVNHVLRETVGKQDVVDLDCQTLSLFARDVHGNLRTQCTPSPQGEDGSEMQCCAMTTLQELCCDCDKSRKVFILYCRLRRARGKFNLMILDSKCLLSYAQQKKNVLMPLNSSFTFARMWNKRLIVGKKINKYIYKNVKKKQNYITKKLQICM